VTFSEAAELFDGVLGYVSRASEFEEYLKNGCVNCGRLRAEHAKSKCLFESTMFRPFPKGTAEAFRDYHDGIRSGSRAPGQADDFWETVAAP
jgi:hypothetical protein